MALYNFDEVIDRRGTNSVKFDFAVEHGLPEDALPLWVADMDFRVPEPVIDALKKAVDHGIFGYSDTKPDYFEALSKWFSERFGWKPKAEWLVKTPGVVFALAMAVRSLTRPGDSVLIQPPVYPPFYNVIRENDRKIVESELVYQNGHYSIDFGDFERKITEQHVKLFILCSPHNPVTRVWTRDELREIGRICARHQVFVVSDEIHCDFAFDEHPHTVFLDANPDLASRSIVCTAPSKTFNLAGLQASNIWIPGASVRAGFLKELSRCGYSGLNRMAIVACQAAYTGGAEWLDACRAYLRANLDFLRDFLREHLPEIRLVEPEGTYFAWLDCSALGLSPDALNSFIVKKARLWLDDGQIFGASGGQFQRVVLACPRKTLEEALSRLENAVRQR